MTYLDLLIFSLYQGLAMVWPFSGDILNAPMFPWITDPAIGPMVKGIIACGALFALTILIHGDIYTLGRGIWALSKRRFDGSTRLLLTVFLASFPLVLADNLMLPDHMDPSWIIAALIILSGLALFFCDRFSVTVRDMEHLSFVTFGVTGLALILGSFLGIAPLLCAILMARLMGCERDQSVRMGFLVILPHLATQGILGFSSAPTPPMAETLLLLITAFIVCFFAAGFLLNWQRRHTLAAPALLQVTLGALAVLSVTHFSR